MSGVIRGKVNCLNFISSGGNDTDYNKSANEWFKNLYDFWDSHPNATLVSRHSGSGSLPGSDTFWDGARPFTHNAWAVFRLEPTSARPFPVYFQFQRGGPNVQNIGASPGAPALLNGGNSVGNSIPRSGFQFAIGEGGTENPFGGTVVVTHPTPDKTNTVDSPDATDEASTVTLANELKADHNAHLGQSGVHSVNDVVNVITTSDATNYATAYTLLNDFKAKYNAHRASTTYHVTADTTNALSTTDASTPATAFALANNAKFLYNYHRRLDRGNDTRSSPIWVVPPGGTRVHVYPRPNNSGGPSGTVAAKSDFAQMAVHDINTFMRYHFIADDDSFVYLFDTGDDNTYSGYFCGLFNPRVDLTLTYPYVMIGSYQAGTGVPFSRASVYGDPNGTGLDNRINGGVVAGLTANGVRQVSMDRYQNIVSSANQPTQQTTVPEYEEFAIPLYTTETSFGLIGVGHLGEIRFVRDSANLSTNDTNAALTRAAFGASDSTGVKLMVPWGGSESPKASSNRAGVSWVRARVPSDD